MLGMVKTLFPGYYAEKDERMMTATTKTKQKSDKATTTCSEDSEQLSATTECGRPCDDSIREKAYLLWEAAGSPPGDGVDFWVQAEKELS